MKKILISILIATITIGSPTAYAAYRLLDTTPETSETEVAQEIAQTEPKAEAKAETKAEATAVEDTKADEPETVKTAVVEDDKTVTKSATIENKQPVTEQKSLDKAVTKSFVATVKRAEATTEKKTTTPSTTQKAKEPTTNTEKSTPSTPATKAPVTTKPATEKTPETTTHQHNYEAICREVPAYEEQPIYEKHTLCAECDFDVTQAAIDSGKDIYMDASDIYREHLRTEHNIVSDSVWARRINVGEPIGYETVRVGTKTVIDHYECLSCGAVKK